MKANDGSPLSHQVSQRVLCQLASLMRDAADTLLEYSDHLNEQVLDYDDQVIAFDLVDSGGAARKQYIALRAMADSLDAVLNAPEGEP